MPGFVIGCNRVHTNIIFAGACAFACEISLVVNQAGENEKVSNMSGLLHEFTEQFMANLNSNCMERQMMVLSGQECSDEYKHGFAVP